MEHPLYPLFLLGGSLALTVVLVIVVFGIAAIQDTLAARQHRKARRG